MKCPCCGTETETTNAELLEAVLSCRRVRFEDGRTAKLSKQEAALMRILVRRPNFTFSFEMLSDQLYRPAGRDEMLSDGAIKVIVCHIRGKLGKGAIRSVHSLGFHADKSAVANVFGVTGVE